MTNQNNEKSKNGKRLALILIAILLLVAIAFGAYTYSRYVTRDSGNGRAQVAAWGFTMSFSQEDYADNEAGFSTAYSNHKPTDVYDTATVLSSSGNTVVAPDTSGSTTFNVLGTSEVAAKITVDFEVVSEVYITITDDSENVYKYTPITFSYGDTQNVKAAQLGAALDTVSVEVHPGNPVSFTNNTISWAWAYTLDGTMGTTAAAYLELVSGSGDSTITINADQADILDTALGQLAANQTVSTQRITIGATSYTILTEEGDYSLSEEINITLKAEQIQSYS